MMSYVKDYNFFSRGGGGDKSQNSNKLSELGRCLLNQCNFWHDYSVLSRVGREYTSTRVLEYIFLSTCMYSVLVPNYEYSTRTRTRVHC